MNENEGESLKQRGQSEQFQGSSIVASSQEDRSWFRGFYEIIVRPERLDALRGANVYKIYFAACLLIAVSMCLSSWLTWQSPALRQQALDCLNYIPLHTGGSPQVAAESFAFTQILATSLMKSGILGLLVSSVVLWTIHRVFTGEPLRFLAILGIVSFAASISCVGYILTSVLQLSTQSIASSFSTAVFFAFNDYPFLHPLLSTFDVFLLWQYAAIGVSISSFLGRSLFIGFLIGFCALLVHVMFSGTLTYLSYQFFMQAK